MNAQVIIDGNDLSSSVVSISRRKNYCNVSQTFSIDFPLSLGTTINTYDSVIIYEEGTKVLTGYVSSATKYAPDGIITVEGQDTFKRASDYFVDDVYYTEAGQTTMYWIEFLLDLAGLSVTFTTPENIFVNPAEPVGLASVEDLILPYIQMSAWYAWVDPDGDIFIGKLRDQFSGIVLSEGDNIIDITTDKTYEKTRNEVHVHGGVDIESFSSITPITAIARKEVPQLPTDQIMVAANPRIKTMASAQRFANELLREASTIANIKSINCLGDSGIQAGTYVEVFSDLYTGRALITSMNSELNADGYTMLLKLDDKCPRLLAHLERESNLYAGTWGGGVYSYDLYTNTWSGISNGLSNLNIVDLSVDQGLFIASTPSGVYVKTNREPWQYQTLPTPTASGFEFGTGSYVYPGVYANGYAGEVNALITYSGGGDEDNYTWLYQGNLTNGGTSVNWRSFPIIASGYPSHGESSGNIDIYGGIYSWPGPYGISSKGANHAPHFAEIYPFFNPTPEPWEPDISLLENAESAPASFACSDGTYIYAVDSDNGSYVVSDKMSDGSRRWGMDIEEAGGVGAHSIVFDGTYLLSFSQDSSVAKVVRISVATGDSELIWSESGYTNPTHYPPVYHNGGWYTVFFDYSPISPPETIYTTGKAIIGKWTNQGASFTDDITSIVSDKYMNISTFVSDEFSNFYFTAGKGEQVGYNPARYDVYGYVIKYDGGSPSITYTHLREEASTRASILLYGMKGTLGKAVLSDAPTFQDGTGYIIDHTGDTLVADDTLSVLATDNSYMFLTDDAGNFYKYTSTGLLDESGTYSGEFLFLTDNTLVFADEDLAPSELYVYSRDTLNLLRTYEFSTTSVTITSALLTGTYFTYNREVFSPNTSWVIPGVNIQGGQTTGFDLEGDYSTKYVVVGSGGGRHLLDTTGSGVFYPYYSKNGFSEVNPDTYPISIYGIDGSWSVDEEAYVEVEVYDMAGKYSLLDVIKYSTTDSNIYKSIVSGSTSVINAVAAQEIVARVYGSGEIFFSQGGEVKKSTDDLQTYVDASTGLPGNTVTVLRLGNSYA